MAADQSSGRDLAADRGAAPVDAAGHCLRSVVAKWQGAEYDAIRHCREEKMQITARFPLSSLILLMLFSAADAQTVTTQETISRSVTVTLPDVPEVGGRCTDTGTVVGLNPRGDNFLSVRLRPNGPAGPGQEVDQLFTNDRVCIVGNQGRWLNVRYLRNGRAFSGWVFDRYIREN